MFSDEMIDFVSAFYETSHAGDLPDRAPNADNHPTDRGTLPMPSTSPPQPPAGDPANPSASGAKPFLRFYYPESLRAKTLALLTTIEQAPDPTRHRNALSDLVMDLTDSGLEYYFLRALDLAKVGFVTKQSAIAGFGTAKRVMGPVVHNVVGHLDKEQLLIICRHIRQLME